ncbi:MAG: hypothetical protein R3Y53_11445 [Bacillota bacterium]
MILKTGIYLIRKTPNQISVKSAAEIKFINYILISKESLRKPEYISIKHYMGDILIIPHDIMKSICEIEFIHETDLSFMHDTPFKRGCNILSPQTMQDIAMHLSLFINLDIETYDENAYCHIFYRNDTIEEEEELGFSFN